MPCWRRRLKRFSRPIFVADVEDDHAGEAVGHAGPQAAGVQDVGDLHVGVIVDQPIDFGDHR